jgi:hypothetical protein
MEDELERAAIAAVKSVGDRGPTTPIPPNVRRAVLAYANAARRSGRSWRDVAGVVGVSAAALHNWRNETPKRDRQRRSSLLAPVVVTQRRDGEGPLVLVTPVGRVEGLDVAGLAELLRRLA